MTIQQRVSWTLDQKWKINQQDKKIWKPVESSQRERIFREHLGQVLEDVGRVEVAVVVQVQLSDEAWKVIEED